MKAGNAHAFTEVERMRIDPMRARVERKCLATALASMGDEPVEHSLAVSVRAKSLARYKIVDVERQAGRKHVLDAKAGNGDDLAFMLKHRELEALDDLLLDL